MAGPGNILIRVGAEAGQAISELSKVDKSLGSTMTTSEKMSAGVKKAALPAAAALGAIGFAAIGAAKAAAEDAAAQEHLAGALKRSTGATDKQIASTEDWISKIALATGVADDELRPALEKIAVATGSVSKAQKFLGQALDIAAASGKDVGTVSAAIAKGYTGQTAALSKLIPGLSESAKKSKDFEVIMAELAKTTGGAAAESANTAAGQYKILQLQMSELQETLGAALLPVIEALLPILRKLGDLAADNTTVVKILVAAAAALASTILVVNAAMKVYGVYAALFVTETGGMTVAQRALNLAMAANPVGLVVVAIAALAAGLYLAYTRSQTFRNIVGDALDVVTNAARALDRAFDAARASAAAAFDWITNHWKLALFAFGPIGAAVYLIAQNFDRIKAAATGAFDAITGAIRTVIAAIQELIGWLGKIKVPRIHLPHIPGIGGLAVGAAGPAARAAGASTVAGVGPGGITVNVFGAVDPEGTARAIRRILVAHDRRQGRIV